MSCGAKQMVSSIIRRIRFVSGGGSAAAAQGKLRNDAVPNAETLSRNLRRANRAPLVSRAIFMICLPVERIQSCAIEPHPWACARARSRSILRTGALRVQEHALVQHLETLRFELVL